MVRTGMQPITVPVAHGSTQALLGFMLRYPRSVMLTGAGISTASGIPGYRDDDGNWKGASPTLLKDFLTSELRRQRYWARSLVGWPILAHATPNAAHRAVAELQQAGYVSRLVTQNVDGLHQRAGATDVIELHGNVDGATCLACGKPETRLALQARMSVANPAFVGAAAAASPDGDAKLERDDFARFIVPHCLHCGGMLKPDVVFFGESVPRDKVDAALTALRQADALIVVGSSLTVFSGYRFCVAAAQAGKPIVAVNLGPTRADPLLALKVAEPAADALVTLIHELGLPRARSTSETDLDRLGS